MWLWCLNLNPLSCLTFVYTLHAWNLLQTMVALFCPLIFLLLSHLLLSDLPSFTICHTCPSVLPRLICTPSFSWSCWPENVHLHSLPASWLPLPLSHFSPAIRPRQRAGTIQRWQNCTRLWVSKETIKAPSKLCSLTQDPHWAAAAPAARHHHASTLKALSHSSLRALYFKPLRDYKATVINLRGPICQHCDCFFLSLNWLWLNDIMCFTVNLIWHWELVGEIGILLHTHAWLNTNMHVHRHTYTDNISTAVHY